MMEQIFAGLPERFVQDTVKEPMSYYFSIDDMKKTVLLSPEGCAVQEGRAVAEADCVCKTSREFFMKIWEDGYRPGMKDFFSGAIKSNNPNALRTFLLSFGKEA